MKVNDSLIYLVRETIQRGISFLSFLTENKEPIFIGFVSFWSQLNSQYLSSRDGDFLTKNYLINFKCSNRSFICGRDILKTIIYYLGGINVGFRAGNHFFSSVYVKNIKKLVFFNPLSNIAYFLKVADIPMS